tara:strand:+ start:6179 stop:6667 length:489 start_codon:yes stop_codon:yes gene_type:complete
MKKPFDTNAAVPFDDEEAPVAISVTVPESMPSAPTITDFIPNPSQNIVRTEVAVARTEDKVFIENVEFRSNAEQAEIGKTRKARILSIAKEIYSKKKSAISEFEQASKLVNTSTKEQKAEPTSDLLEAMLIVEKGRPMTKARAMERAKKEVANQESNPELLS